MINDNLNFHSIFFSDGLTSDGLTSVGFNSHGLEPIALNLCGAMTRSVVQEGHPFSFQNEYALGLDVPICLCKYSGRYIYLCQLFFVLEGQTLTSIIIHKIEHSF